MHDEAMTVLPRLLEVFEIRRPILVGHSDGASIALIHAGSGAGDPFALILEAPHVFVEDVTVARIAELRDLYQHERPPDEARTPSRRERRHAVSVLDRRLAAARVPRVEYRGLPARREVPRADHPGQAGRIRNRPPGEHARGCARRAV